MKKVSAQIMIIFNCIIIVILLVAVVIGSEKQRESRQNEIKMGFKEMIYYSGNVAGFRMKEEQFNCKELAEIVNQGAMTMEEVIIRLDHNENNLNSTIQIISKKDRAGYEIRLKDSFTKMVQYDEDRMKLLEEAYEKKEKGNEILLTSVYNNPLDSKRVISFVEKVTLLDEKKVPYEAFLLNVFEYEEFAKVWSFQEAFSGCNIILLSEKHDYIIKDGDNFSVDFYRNLIDKYSLTDKSQKKDTDAVRKDMGFFEETNGGRQNYFVVYTKINHGEHILIGLVDETKIDFNLKSNTSLILFILYICGIVLVNGFYIFNVDRGMKAQMHEMKNIRDEKIQFVYNMVRGIKADVRTILGLAKAANIDTSNHKKVIACLDKIEVISEDLEDFVNSSYDLLSIDYGTFSLRNDSVSVLSLAKRNIDELQLQIKEKNIDFEFLSHEIEWNWIDADGERLRQICKNLLKNAINYTEPDGKIVFEIWQKSIRNRKDIKEMHIEISDTGIGMKEEFLKKIYQPFSREKNKKNDMIDGNGISLAVIKMLLEMMRGKIDIQSEVAKGTKVHIIIPIRQGEEREEIDELKFQEKKWYNGMHFLVAEDDDINWDYLCELLKHKGMSADRVENGEEVVEKLEKTEAGVYDAVLMDIKMPVLNGRDATRIIRNSKREYVKNIPIIAMVADSFSDDRKKCKEAGMDGHIIKPVNIQSLIEELEIICKKS